MVTNKQAPFVNRDNFGKFLNSLGLSGTGVEVGTHLGEYALVLLKSWECQRLYCIDPWTNPEGYEEQAALLWGGSKDREEDLIKCKDNLKDYLNKKAHLIRDYSSNAVRGFTEGTLDFVYIDGDHRCDKLFSDLEEWWVKIKPGGILAGHDYIQPGDVSKWAGEVQLAVNMFAQKYGLDIYYVIEEKCSPWSFYFQKARYTPPRPKEEDIAIARRIGLFYLQNSLSESNAANLVHNLAISNIRSEGDTVHIHTSRPGVIIGKMGKNIEKLSKFLGMKIRVHEEPWSWNDFLLSGSYYTGEEPTLRSSE